VKRKEALAQLNHDDNMLRLLAAQELQKKARPIDLGPLTTARERERSPWVQHALDLTIRGLGGATYSGDDGVEEIDGSLDVSQESDAESRATERIARIMNHELGPIIGRLEVAASLELPSYGVGKTSYAEIQKLKRLAESITMLASAARSPKKESIELAGAVRDATARVVASPEPLAHIMVSHVGPEPLIVTSDRFLLDLVIENALRNSFDALKTSKPQEEWSVVATWGTDRKSVWIAINDNGPGLDALPSQLVEPGVTNKEGHAGFGLFIVQQAIKSMGAIFEIKNASEGGAVFRVEWSKQ
jgi:signal transduction histidine kinase